MVREFPNMAVAIMRELAHRLELTNQQLRTALSELRELRGGTATCSRTPMRPMSRLDSFIRRLEAQRACLNRAAALISGIDGTVLELGLGNGRTYDHLRELFPDREIYVCERRVAAHPACVPPGNF